jgi:hypothetical protein
MQRLIVGALCVFLSSTLCAQSQDSANQSSNILVASGAVYIAHCDSKCKDMRCPDQAACANACKENKGTMSMCPRAAEKGK